MKKFPLYVIFIYFFLFLHTATGQVIGGGDNSINGQTNVVSGQIFYYTVSGLQPSNYSWEITGGQITSSTAGSATVVWSTGTSSGKLTYKTKFSILAELNVTISQPPSPPSTSSVARCGSGTVTMTASGAPSGGTYRWYSASSGGSVLYTGSTYTRNVSGTRNYYVSAVSSAGFESNRTSIRVTINPTPNTPSASNRSRCGSGTVNLTASGAPSGGNYRWYAASSGGSVLSTGSSYSPSVSSTRNYYVSATSTAGCEGPRKQVTVTIQPTPSLPLASNMERCDAGRLTFTATGARSGETYQWFSSSSGSVIHTGSSYTTPVLTASKYYWVSIINESFCEGAKKRVTAVITAPPSPPTAANQSRCGAGTVTFTASGAPSGGTYRWYEGSVTGTFVGSGATFTTDNLTATTNFTVKAVSADGCVGLAGTTVTAMVNMVPSVPSAANITRCGSGTVNLTASGAPSGGNYRWYAASSGGSVLSTGSSYSPSVSSTRNYYVSATSTAGCEGPRKQVTVTIQPTPLLPIASNMERCDAGRLTFTATGAGSGETYQWFSSSSGSVIHTGSSYTTPVLNANTDYWVSIINESFCEGAKKKVTAVITAPPSPPTAANQSRCGAGTVTFTASGAPSGGTYRWYEGSVTGTFVGSGATFTTDNLTATTNFTVKAVSADGCVGLAGTTVTAMVNMVPSVPSAANITRCGSGTVNLTASGAPSEGSYKWYAASSGGSALGTGSSYSSFVSETTTYYVSAVANGGCESLRQPVTINIENKPAAPTASGLSRCGEGILVLTASGAPEGSRYKWYKASQPETVVGTESLFTTGVLFESTDYLVSIVAPMGCESDKTPVSAIILDPDNLPKIESGSGALVNKLGETVTLSVDPIPAAIDYEWHLDSPEGTLVNIGLTYTVEVYENKDYYVNPILGGSACTSNDSYKVSQILMHEIDIISLGIHEISDGESIKLSSSHEGDSYEWYKEDALVGSDKDLIVTEAGTYSLKLIKMLDGAAVYFEARDQYHVFNRSTFIAADKDYFKTDIIRKEAVRDLGELSNLTNSEIAEQIVYFDEAGRVDQAISMHTGPNSEDIISFNEYSDYGRQTRKYLPFANLAESGSYREEVASLQQHFYQSPENGITGTEFPFSEVVFDEHYAAKVVESGHVGEAWQIERDANGESTGTGNTVKADDRFTNSDDITVRKWATNGTSTTTYAAGELYVTSITDEDGKTNYAYSNIYGQQVLKRSAAETMTYYVYDGYGRVSYIIPPLATEKMVENNDFNVANYQALVYSFNYDERSRLIERRVPGKGVEYIVYDHWNRPLLTQNAILRKTNQWQFAKYDQDFRPIMFGLYRNNSKTSRVSMQNLVNGLAYDQGDQYYEVLAANSYGYSTDLSFPSTNIIINSVNYYDDYDLDRDGNPDYSYDPYQLAEAVDNAYERTLGMATATKQRVMETEEWVIGVYFYDEEGHIIQTQSNNIQNSQVADIGTAVYDWEGKLLQTKAIHQGEEAISTAQRSVFDHAGRILATHHQVADLVNWTGLVGYEQDEQGNLIHTGAAGYGNTNAYSTQAVTIEDDIILSTNIASQGRFLIGLNDNPSSTSYGNIDYCVFAAANGNLYIYENGSRRTAAGVTPYQLGDEISIHKTGTGIKYYHNNQLIYTSATAVSAPLYVDLTSYNVGDKIAPTSLTYGGEQQIAAYNYNAMGQLIEKNLHKEETGFLQSVDLQYHIRGWLSGINNLALAEEDTDNREDFFGMTLQYEEENSEKYNGSITAMSWKTSGTTTASKYDYTYDDLNRLTAADYSEIDTTSSTQFDMTAAYDANGNITALTRFGQSGRIDALTYTYTDNSNQLIAVADAEIEAGFKDGNTTGDDYAYDENGNQISDKNKGISAIVYNFMDKPISITFEDGSSIENDYTAAGTRIRQIFYDATGAEQKSVEYLSGMVYENDKIQFMSIADGRIVRDVEHAGQWEYQYHISDHLGNVRAMFTSKPKTITFDLNYESDASDDGELFENVAAATIDETDFFDHTDGPQQGTYTNAQQLTGAAGSTVGSVLSIPVKPGDKVSAEVYAHYLQAQGAENPMAAIGNALIAALTGGGPTGTIEGSISNSYGSTGSIITNNQAYANTVEQDKPMAFLNLLFLPDEPSSMVANSNFKYAQVSGASNGEHALLTLDEAFEVPQAGVVVVYLSNESRQVSPVFFDDLKITVEQSNLIQLNEYFPYGMQQATSWTRSVGLGNKYLFNGGSELNEKTQNYETFYRNYDAALGRFNGIDIKATKYASLSPYQFAGNNPVSYNDPMGDEFLSDAQVSMMERNANDWWSNRDMSGNRGGGIGGYAGGYNSSRGGGPRYGSGGRSRSFRNDDMHNLMNHSFWDWDGSNGPYDGYNAIDPKFERAKRLGTYVGSGASGYGNALLMFNQAEKNAIGQDFGTFKFSLAGKLYGGDYHRNDGVYTSTAVRRLLLDSSTGGWFGVGEAIITEFGSIKGNTNGGGDDNWLFNIPIKNAYVTESSSEFKLKYLFKLEIKTAVTNKETGYNGDGAYITNSISNKGLNSQFELTKNGSGYYISSDNIGLALNLGSNKIFGGGQFMGGHFGFGYNNNGKPTDMTFSVTIDPAIPITLALIYTGQVYGVPYALAF